MEESPGLKYERSSIKSTLEALGRAIVVIANGREDKGLILAVEEEMEIKGDLFALRERLFKMANTSAENIEKLLPKK